MHALIGYGTAVTVILIVISAITWRARYPSRLSYIRIVSAGFFLGMLGMYIAATIYGYHQ